MCNIISNRHSRTITFEKTLSQMELLLLMQSNQEMTHEGHNGTISYFVTLWFCSWINWPKRTFSWPGQRCLCCRGCNYFMNKFLIVLPIKSPKQAVWGHHYLSLIFSYACTRCETSIGLWQPVKNTHTYNSNMFFYSCTNKFLFHLNFILQMEAE